MIRKYSLSFTLYIALLSILSYSCKKEEGFGGKATIKGKLIERVYDKDFTTLYKTIPAADMDIYILFGNDEIIGDDVKTSSTGAFEFSYLLPGTYRIYFYSEDSLNNNTDNNAVIVKEITISGDETIDLGTLVCYKTIDYDDGSSTIKGNIRDWVYDKEFKVLQSISPAADRDVYIQNSTNNTIIDNVKTSPTGDFAFSHLVPGSYRIYYYSEDSANRDTDNNMVVSKEVQISDNAIIDLGTLVRYKTLDYDEGSSTIKGNILDCIYDKEFKVLQGISPAADRDVYIQYGTNNSITDDVKTSSTGSFEFSHLLPGTYRIYFYSADSLNNIVDNDAVVMKEFTISANETKDLGTLTRYRTLDYDEGTSAAKGVIMANYFSKNFTYWQGYSGAQDQEVYLVYNNRPYSETRVRTLFNGYYAFPNLIKGAYKVYIYSESRTGDTQKTVFEETFEITGNNQIAQIDTITIDIIP